MVRRLALVAVLTTLLGIAASAQAQSDRTIDVIEVSGVMDERLIEFVETTIAGVAATSEVVILELNSEAAVSADIGRLVAAIEAGPPVPLVVWLGPRPAVAQGGPLAMLVAAPLRFAAPGTEIGRRYPIVAGEDTFSDEYLTDFPQLDGRLTVEEPIPGVIDELHPALTNVVAALDGRQFVIDGEVRTLETSEEFTDDDGVIRTRPSAVIRFHEPGLFTRALRVSLAPEAMFFFLVAGLAVAAFEFYAAGVGVAAAVAVLSLLMAGYGLATLPVQWWAVALVLGGLFLYLVDFQRVSMGVGSLAGTGMLLWGGRHIIDDAQIGVSWWPIVLTVVAVALFFLFAMTTVVRARFSTPTIGRDDLVGRRGVAATDVRPDGLVTLEGARWQATAHRESGIASGDPVIVVGVDGIILEVESLET